MNTLLENYKPGRPENKPKLLEQIKKMEEERAKRLEDHNKMLQSQQKLLSYNTEREYEKKLSDKNILISELLKKITQLTIEVNELRHSTSTSTSTSTI